VFSAQIFQENTFLKIKSNFPLTGKCFPLTNFSNGKQTHENLKSDFLETTFRKTNTVKRKNIFLETKLNFSLTVKYFSLTNFFNDKQIQESLKNNFSKTNTSFIYSCTYKECSEWIYLKSSRSWQTTQCLTILWVLRNLFQCNLGSFEKLRCPFIHIFYTFSKDIMRWELGKLEH
jgi:hypothetical protein